MERFGFVEIQLFYLFSWSIGSRDSAEGHSEWYVHDTNPMSSRLFLLARMLFERVVFYAFR